MPVADCQGMFFGVSGVTGEGVNGAVDIAQVSFTEIKPEIETQLELQIMQMEFEEELRLQKQELMEFFDSFMVASSDPNLKSLESEISDLRTQLKNLEKRLQLIKENLADLSFTDEFEKSSNQHVQTIQTTLEGLGTKVESIHDYIDRREILKNLYNAVDNEYKKSYSTTKKLANAVTYSEGHTELIKQQVSQDWRFFWVLLGLLVLALSIGFSFYKILTIEKIHTL